MALAACDDGGTSKPSACTPVGDGAAPAVVELVEIGEDGAFHTISDGGEIHLQRPLQGGHVVYIGARVTGICVDQVAITGRIRDLATRRVVAKETRQGLALDDRGDGTALPHEATLGDVANIALCPDLTGDTDVMGTTFTLELEVADTAGRVAQASARVTPVCGQTEGSPERSTCECECRIGAQNGGCG